MQTLIDFCDKKNVAKINLEVCSINSVAISLYQKWGFRQVGRRKGYYRDGDGLLFSRFARLGPVLL